MPFSVQYDKWDNNRVLHNCKLLWNIFFRVLCVLLMVHDYSRAFSAWDSSHHLTSVSQHSCWSLVLTAWCPVHWLALYDIIICFVQRDVAHCWLMHNHTVTSASLIPRLFTHMGKIWVRPYETRITYCRQVLANNNHSRSCITTEVTINGFAHALKIIRTYNISNFDFSISLFSCSSGT